MPLSLIFLSLRIIHPKQCEQMLLLWVGLFSPPPGSGGERSGSQLQTEFYFIHVSPAELGKAGVDDVSLTPCVASAAHGEKAEADQPLAGVASAAENVSLTASGGLNPGSATY